MILETIASFKEELKQLGKWSKDEINQMLDDGIQKYVINYEDKFGKTKTFLFRDQRVDFYKIYFPLSLCTHKNKRAFNVPLVTDSLFDKSHCITILGNAGSGKTMLLKHCFLSTLKHSTQIPIIIELRKLNTYPGTLSEYIQEQVFAHKLVQNGSILDRLLGSGKFTFMFDGFDELSLQSKDQHIRELDAFIDKYNNNYYLLTSRPGANAESLTRFNNYQVCSLTPRQIEKFIHIQLSLIEDCKALENKILELINKPENESYRSYLSSPLLLSMFILTFSTHPELPTLRSKFYYNVFDTLYSRHDTISKSGGYTHDKKTKLEKEQIEIVLKWFSYISYFESNFLFDKQYLSATLDKVKQHIGIDFKTDDLIYDLSVAISILVAEGLDYSFPHRSLQEYFTAVLIKSLPEQIRKEKIYGGKFTLGNVYINLNLWKLCSEIDKDCFNKFFLVNELNKIIKELETGVADKKNDRVLIAYNYLKSFGAIMYFDKKINLEAIKYPNTYCMALIRFLKINYINLSDHSVLFHKYPSHLKPYLKKTKNNDIFSYTYNLSEIDDTRMRLYKESGIVDKIYEIYTEIIKKKQSIDKKLKETYKNEVSLLDLV